MFVRTKMRLKGETKIFEFKKRRNTNEMRSIYIFARISEGDHFFTKFIFASTSGDVRTTLEPFLKFPYFCCLIAPRPGGFRRSLDISVYKPDLVTYILDLLRSILPGLSAAFSGSALAEVGAAFPGWLQLK